LIDRKGVQARAHLKDRLRLSVFLTELLAASHTVAFSSLPTFTAAQLSANDVLVITTRSSEDYDYTQEEIRDIVDFVRNGGGLLLASNHADAADGHTIDFRKNDAKLAASFGVTLERTYFIHPAPGERTRISGPALNGAHPIITGAPGERPVESIVTNTCCSIATDTGVRLVDLPDEMVDRYGGLLARDRAFAYLLDGVTGLNPRVEGRVVVIADSGFIGTDLTVRPGIGLIGQAHNLRFIMNVVRWLGGELG
jgi:hypothetical protein